MFQIYRPTVFYKNRSVGYKTKNNWLIRLNNSKKKIQNEGNGGRRVIFYILKWNKVKYHQKQKHFFLGRCLLLLWILEPFQHVTMICGPSNPQWQTIDPKHEEAKKKKHSQTQAWWDRVMMHSIQQKSCISSFPLSRVQWVILLYPEFLGLVLSSFPSTFN